MNIVVIGGGAAGFFAAIHAAENGCNVVILEKSDKLLTKVKVSGGGRCNVTNGCDDQELFVRNYPRGYKELKGPFSKFNRLHTIEWFALRGVVLKTETDGRMFPESNTSQTIVDTLLQAATDSKIKIFNKQRVTSIQKSETDFVINTYGEKFLADKVIIATGGNPSIEFYNWLIELGHKIIEPVPSLFTFNIPDNKYKNLMGVAIHEVQIKINNSTFKETGPLLFTHWGVSGPAVLKLSAWAARFLNELNYQFEITINFLPQFSANEIKDFFVDLRMNSLVKRIVKTKVFGLPNSLWSKICDLENIDPLLSWSDCSNDKINRLIYNLQNTCMKVSGKTTFREEFVTCGGIDLKQVNMKTMESKIQPGLFFAGEVLNIDGVTGGFNFQAAWTTGFIAGTSCCK